MNRIHWKKHCQGLNGLLLPDQGLVFEQVEHTGRSVHAPEEIDRIEELVEAPLGSKYIISKNGITEDGMIDGNKILVTAPYNVQDNKLDERLAGRARVGTVDYFHGQETPLGIFSLTASNAKISPRGIDFSPPNNQMNVALSKAQCISTRTSGPKEENSTALNSNNARRLSNLVQIKAHAP